MIQAQSRQFSCVLMALAAFCIVGIADRAGKGHLRGKSLFGGFGLFSGIVFVPFQIFNHANIEKFTSVPPMFFSMFIDPPEKNAIDSQSDLLRFGSFRHFRSVAFLNIHFNTHLHRYPMRYTIGITRFLIRRVVGVETGKLCELLGPKGCTMLSKLEEKAERVEWLARKVLRRVKGDVPIRQTMHRVIDSMAVGVDWFLHIDERLLDEALNAFAALTETEQRHVLNGWKYNPNYPSWREVAGVSDDSVVQRMAVITAHGNEATSHIDYDFDSSMGGLDVLIREGMSLEDVQTKLAMIMQMLHSGWSRIVDGEFVIYKKGGISVPIDTLTRASNGSDKSGSPMAA